ncbi:MAG: FADH(2)-oxidizing methylenetetrahydrofolate--tRNA-(uracil(54)-C(5))-methyltransferase TrmFO [Peptococcaceae bacterium]|nr:FADH(2)-oxidizing methylenetetrahydrofolate--tRNA-(uracil(54)-C(5))-methyltransferase TrmFO [Peptococcaceae bacterium]
MSEGVKVIGGGLAGSEAAWQLAKRGIPVILYEMRPAANTPAHHTEELAELVCSNSLRANSITNAVGLLKEEMRRLDSLIIACADANQVPAGEALAVDRHGFSQMVTQRISSHPLIELRREEVCELPDEGIGILATGPLTSPAMAMELQRLSGARDLYFYDAAAPLVQTESLDQSKGFWASRYGKGEKDYFNCPMTEEEYTAFYEALISARVTPARDFEEERFFEGCMPVEVLAKRGIKTLLFGPMKPVGLEDPESGRRPYAVVQLRQDDSACLLMNIVGFQTRLARPEQERVFGMIPALAKAEYARYGMVHRNTFINSPSMLEADGRLKGREGLFAAGQMTGVEGYVESAASGLAAGINAGLVYKGLPTAIYPAETALGALLRYIVTAEEKHFQPMNVNFGLMPPLPDPPRDKKRKNQMYADRAFKALDRFIADTKIMDS